MNRFTTFAALIGLMSLGLMRSALAADDAGPAKATSITLHMHEVAAQQALESIEQQSGLTLQPFSKGAADRLLLTPVTIDADGQPFWSVLLKILEPANLVPGAYLKNQTGLTLSDLGGGWLPQFTSVKGPFAVALTTVAQRVNLDYGRRNPPLPAPVTLTFQICPEPKVPAQCVTRMHIDKCVDESGFPIAVEDKTFFQFFSWPSYQPMQVRPEGSKKIALVEGEVAVRIEGAHQHLEIAQILQARDISNTIDGVQLQVRQCIKQGNQFTLRVLVSKKTEDQAELKEIADRIAKSHPQLQDATGKALYPGLNQSMPQQNADGFQMQFFFTLGNNGRDLAGEPVKLVWEVPKDTYEVTIPFSFKDVPLPAGKNPVIAKAPAAPVARPTTMPAIAGVIPTKSIDYVKRIDELTKELGDGPEKRQDALIALSLLPPSTLEQIEPVANRKNLVPPARQALLDFVRREKPLHEARMRREKVLEEERNWDERTAIEAYLRVGDHNAKWDELAQRGIHVYCQTPRNTPPTEARAALETAMAAGCTDPMVLSMAADVRVRSGWDPHDVLNLYQGAHDRMMHSAYPAYRKEWLIVRYLALDFNTANSEAYARQAKVLDQPMVNVLRRLRSEMMVTWPGVAKDGAPTGLLEQMVAEVFHWSGADDEGAYKKIAPPLEAAMPNSPVPLWFKGVFYEEWARRARGEGDADQITPERRKLMAERMDIAQQALQKAYEMDPRDPRIPTDMFRVERGLDKGPAVMEMWFKRAMDADPDNLEACEAKLDYLEPRWHGNDGEMLRFGKQCYESGNWRARLPLLLAEAHRRLCAYEPDPIGYVHRPDIWTDVERVCEPYLRVVPDDIERRSYYCALACFATQWKIAKAQFQILGPHVVPRLFGYGSMDEVNQYRQKALAGN